MINILILATSEHSSFFAKKVTSNIRIDAIFSCNVFSKKLKDSNILLIRGFIQWKKYLIEEIRDEKVNIFILDYSALEIYLALKMAKQYKPKAKINFIQHGIFENRKKEALFPIKTLNWFLMTTYFIMQFFRIDKNSIIKKVKIIIDYAKKGSDYGVLKLIPHYPIIDNCFFWDNYSLSCFNFFEDKGQYFKNKDVCGLPDEVDFRYKLNNKIYFITQPLYKTGHCTLSQYKQIILETLNKYESLGYEVYFILHPRIQIEEIGMSIKCFYLSQLPTVIFAEKLIGHFSSLLLSSSSRELVIIQVDGGINVIKKSNQKFFSKYLKNSSFKERGNFFKVIKSKLEL